MRRSPALRARKYAELGFRSQVQGAPRSIRGRSSIGERCARGDGAAWNHVAMEQAIQEMPVLSRGSASLADR